MVLLLLSCLFFSTNRNFPLLPTYTIPMKYPSALPTYHISGFELQALWNKGGLAPLADFSQTHWFQSVCLADITEWSTGAPLRPRVGSSSSWLLVAPIMWTIKGTRVIAANVASHSCIMAIFDHGDVRIHNPPLIPTEGNCKICTKLVKLGPCQLQKSFNSDNGTSNCHRYLCCQCQQRELRQLG